MKNILLIGQLCDISGYGNAVRSYFKVLSELHSKKFINLKIINFSFERYSTLSEEEVENISKFDLLNSVNRKYEELFLLSIEDKQKLEKYKEKEYELIFFLTNDWLSSGFEQKIPGLNLYDLATKAKNVYPCVVWETDKVPYSILESYNKLSNIHTLLCACTWNAETFSKYTNLNTVVIPYNLEHKEQYDIETFSSLEKAKGNNFSFCTVSQWGWRKGFDILLKSYLLEFYNDEVILFLRTYQAKAMTNNDETSFFIEQIKKFKDSIRINSQKTDFKCKIVLLNSLMSEEQINSIYKSSDTYITCTRGEGFGLPIAEFSLMTGRPIIAPNLGGHLDLINKEELLIDSRYEPCYLDKDVNAMYSSEMNIIESSINSTRQKMRQVFELYKNNQVHFNSLGKDIQLNIQEKLNFKRNVKLFKEVLCLPIGE